MPRVRIEFDIVRFLRSKSTPRSLAMAFAKTNFAFSASSGRNPRCEAAKGNIGDNKYFSAVGKRWSQEKTQAEGECTEQIDGHDDLRLLKETLTEIIEYRTKNISSWIIEEKVKILCESYVSLSIPLRNEFLELLARDHGINHGEVIKAAKALHEKTESDLKMVKSEEQLKNLLTPHYLWLFVHVGKLKKGVKFLVDLRKNVLDLIAQKHSNNSPVLELQQLNATLRDLLSMWFTVGFLELERITWKSSCEMLQKISEYEAVHPVRSWTDLKRRVGPYRRCFVFLHASMPGEPIVVLHTALTEEISRSMNEFVSPPSRTTEREAFDDFQEDPEKAKAAIFYSISSTQKGLQGIELGNYLIKRVARELQNEFPRITQHSSISPIPLFRAWLLERLKCAERGHNDVLFKREIDEFEVHFSSSDVFKQLREVIASNKWVEDSALSQLLETPLMRLCARYLYLEKRRGYTLDKVANFHLRNGAVMWRLNWKAYLSPRGLNNSCGIMVNYRYFLDETEAKSRAYLECRTVSASEEVVSLASEAQKLTVTSKM